MRRRRAVRAEHGDTVGTLAARYGMSVPELLSLNGISSSAEAVDTWILRGIRDPSDRATQIRITGGGGFREPFIPALSPDVVRRLGRAKMTTSTVVWVVER